MRRHVLVVRLDNAGDVLLAGPTVRAVSASGAFITMLCGPNGAEAGALLPGVDDIVVHQAPWVDADPRPIDSLRIIALVDDLARRAIDEALVLTSFHQSPLPMALLLRMAGVPTIAAICDDYPGSLLDVRHHVGECHEVERGLSLAATLGHVLPESDGGRLAIRDCVPCDRSEPPVDVVVHPGASVPARTWPPSRWAQLVARLTASGRSVAVTGSERERDLTAAVAAPGGPHATDLGGRHDLAGLAGCLAGAAVVVTGNTGPAHLAAAVGTPVVSLFPPTVPARRWRPWRVAHELLGWQDIGCGGCRARVCPVPGQPCLAVVSVADVVDAVARVAWAGAKAAA
ncbi:MAG: glycosyl transferase, family 9 [Acidimicrobiales bacterium]|jgi:ADP-heptose:LPS heptosyltransferase|nr:glycosyl transferase, family 9 [Acidimicrobiales bacterium]